MDAVAHAFRRFASSITNRKAKAGLNNGTIMALVGTTITLMDVSVGDLG